MFLKLFVGDEDEMPKLELEDEEKNNNPPDSARSTLQRYVSQRKVTDAIPYNCFIGE